MTDLSTTESEPRHALPVKPLLVLAAMAGATAVGGAIAVSAMNRAIAERAKNPPKPAAAELDKDFAVVPDFSLTERSERKITRQDFLGRVSVFGFVFTTCPSTCKMVTGVMARLRRELPPQVQMSSITVDPIHDTPAVLRDYAAQQNADAATWWFLTGQRNAVYDLVRNGFKLPIEENALIKRPTDEPITHSSRLALVDKKGRIRGYYEASDNAAADALVRKAKKLLYESD